MKVLLTGCKGQLGIELIKQLKQTGKTEIVETDLHNLDITNYQSVQGLVKESSPNIIINCAAFTNVDGCESDENNAYRVNALGARNLAAAAFEVGAKVMQISTDYVFDGTGSTPKREYDLINPQSVYGKSKALGETMVRECNPRHYIVRTAWLYGDGNNFVRTILRLAQEREELTIVDDQIGSPTSTVDLSRCIVQLIQTENYGTYHGTCEGYCSWYDFALKILEITNRNLKVTPITTEQLNRPASRPKYSVLENFMLNLIGLNCFRSWEEALEEYLEVK